jgi:hypothetical protein
VAVLDRGVVLEGDARLQEAHAANPKSPRGRPGMPGRPTCCPTADPRFAPMDSSKLTKNRATQP